MHQSTDFLENMVNFEKKIQLRHVFQTSKLSKSKHELNNFKDKPYSNLIKKHKTEILSF